MTPEQQKELKILIIIIAIIVILIVAKKFLKTIFVGLHLMKSDEQNEVDTAAENIEKNVDVLKAFDPKFYLEVNKNPKTFATQMNGKKRNQLCDQIYNGIGYVYDDPEKVYGAFQQIGTMTEVSTVAERFEQLYKKSLLNFLSQHLDTENQKQAWIKIMKMVKSLPTGINKANTQSPLKK